LSNYENSISKEKFGVFLVYRQRVAGGAASRTGKKVGSFDAICTLAAMTGKDNHFRKSQNRTANQS